MTDRYNQEKFFNSTLYNIEKNLTKFLYETNFTNSQSLYLREEISKFKDKLMNRSNSQNLLQANYSQIKKKIFPLINNRIDTNKINRNNSIFTPIISNKNIISGKQDINHILVKESLRKEVKEFSHKRYLKYSNEKRNNQLYHTQLIDKNMNFIIRNKDMQKGLFDMINKGLIPKNSDVTPAFNRDGNPFSITAKNFYQMKKTTLNKSELTSATINKMRYRPEYNLEIFYKTFQQKPKKNEIHKDQKFKKIKEPIKRIKSYNKIGVVLPIPTRESDTKNEEKLVLKRNYFENINENDFIMKHLFNKTNHLFSRRDLNHKSFYDYIKNIDLSKNINIKFKNFKLIPDENFETFKENNIDKWNKIENILGNFSILLEKLNINYTEIDSAKIIKLIDYYKGDITLITNKNLLICLNEKELKAKGFNPENEKHLYMKIKELFIIRIQKNIRRMFAIKKYNNIKLLNFYSFVIQSYVRGYLKRIKIKKELKKFRENMHKRYLEILEDFKKNYDSNKNKQKIEIHINSLSYDSSMNCTIDKYMLKESLQLNRLIKLKDKNLKIIYILPFNLSDEILSYYFGALEAVGVTDIKNRIKFLVPEACESFPEYFSLSKLLYLSPKTLSIIRILCRNKFAYIVPGIVGKIEEYLSYLLDIPILMGNPEKINTLFNKSGVKSFLEMNEIPFPMSAWDIKTSEEFYSSLAHLIAIYPSIRIWIMKSNNDINGRTISYLDTDKIDFIVQLKKDKKKDKYITVEFFQEKLYYQLKNIVNKNIVFCYPNFFKDWDEYLKNFLSNKGIIEACPTKYLDGIMGHPCIPILIEPNGKIKILQTFEKINSDYFKNIICTSPQECIDPEELNKVAKKLGTFFYLQNIIGYITIECITFHNGKKILYWCTDVIYGLTQTISDILYGHFLYNQAKEKANELETNEFWKNKLNEENSTNKENNENINTKNSGFTSSIIEEKNINNNLMTNIKVFNIPYITTEIIKDIKLKNFLRDYKYNNIMFNINKREGVIFNLCDGLECGLFGMCGIINNENYERINLDFKLWKLIDRSLEVLKSSMYNANKKAVLSSINKQVFGSLDRTDIFSIHLIFAKVKKILKAKELEAKKVENRMKKIANEDFL